MKRYKTPREIPSLRSPELLHVQPQREPAGLVVQPQGSFVLEENAYPFIWLYLGFKQNLPRNIHVSELCVGPKFWSGPLL